MPNATQKLYLVRHGETEWTLAGRATGRTDLPLTTRGEEEAERLRPRLSRVPFERVLTSPLVRARRTGELAGFSARLEDDADLMEWNYGDYEGRKTAEVRTERPGWSLFPDGCPGGESADDVGVRVDRVIRRVRAQAGDVAVFAHRDVLRVLAARWLDLPSLDGRRFFLDTASVSVLGYHHDVTEPVVCLWNDRTL